MKKIILFLIILVGILSCNDKFSLTSPYTIDKEYVKDRYSCFNNNDCDNLKDENLNCDLDDPKGEKCVCDEEMRICQSACHNNSCPENITTCNNRTGECECVDDKEHDIDYIYDKETNSCIVNNSWHNFEFSLGKNHTCTIKSGSLFCWGSNDTGKLGIDDESNGTKNTPQRIGSDKDWLLVANSFDFSCGLKGRELGADAYLYCWGKGLGKPEKIGNMKIWKSIALNKDSIFLLDDEGALYERNNNFNDDNLKTNPEKKNIGNNSGWQYFSVYNYYTCAINKNNKLFCWDKGVTEIPVQMGNDNWEKVSCGENYACGINTEGKLFCWGNNENCKLGTDCAEFIKNDKTDPTPVTEGWNDWTDIKTGSNYACAIKNNKYLYCWGSNEHGEITADKTFHEYTDNCIHENEQYDICYSPLMIDIGLNIEVDLKEIKLGLYENKPYKCILDSNHKLHCWGHNNSGQLGTTNTCNEGYCGTPQEIHFPE